MFAVKYIAFSNSLLKPPRYLQITAFNFISSPSRSHEVQTLQFCCEANKIS